MSDKANFKQDILETERLLLKELNPEIMYNLFTYFSDDEIIEYLGLRSENELELERMKFEQGYTTFKTSFKNFLIIEKESDFIIGRTGFHTWYIHHFRGEMGYDIRDDHNMGKGFMTEANRAIIEYGFENMDLNRIEAFTGTNNTASHKLLKKLGFKEEGLLREHYFKNNRIEDSLCFGLLKKEYEQ